MPYVEDDGNWSQVPEELALKQQGLEAKQYVCRWPRCFSFGVVHGQDNHFGTIYRCNCLPVFWVIDPQTGDHVEGC